VAKPAPIDPKDHAAVIAWCTKEKIGLVVVGADDYLAAGLVDALHAARIATFGPTQAAAEIEWSKAYAKKVMHEARIPTARSQTFSDMEAALAYCKTHPLPIVIKASGLAQGKGVVIAPDHVAATETITSFMRDKQFGDSGSTVVIEEYLVGEEISVHAICDGTRALVFPAAQDHKRAYDGDMGLNTGGMGTIAPVPWISKKDMSRIEAEIVLPLLRYMKKQKRPFKGLLFPGVMMTADGPKVIEFNARFGDPETQSYMRLMKSDIVPLLLASAKGNIAGKRIQWRRGAACCISVVSGGYPGEYKKGYAITGIPKRAQDIELFHAGTKKEGDGFVTSGGRVMSVTALKKDLRTALRAAYATAAKIQFTGARFRTDIGARSLALGAKKKR
jgi:phosphoribosylamine--glycine ligase